MDEQFTPLQLWEAEKNLLLYFNEINTYYELISSDIDDYDQEDMAILALDIDHALTAVSDNFYIGLSELDEHATLQQVSGYLVALHDYIITNSLISFATDIVESAPHFNPILDFLLKNHKEKKSLLHSIAILEYTRDIMYDIMAWAELYHIHNGTDIHELISTRTNSALNIITRDPDLNDDEIGSRDSIDSTKAFRSYFIKDYDPYKIAKINARINELGSKKKEGYKTNIAALIAYLYTKKVLCKTYKETLAHIFKRLGIKDDPTGFKPAQFKRCSIKGTVPANWTEAEKFFNSL